MFKKLEVPKKPQTILPFAGGGGRSDGCIGLAMVDCCSCKTPSLLYHNEQVFFTVPSSPNE